MSERSDDRHFAAADVPARVAELERLWREASQGEGEHDALAGMLVEARALASEGERSGYPKVAELASIIEVMLEPLADGSELLTGEFKEILRDYLKALGRLGEQAPRRPVEPKLEADLAAPVLDRDAFCVFMLEPDEALAADLSHQIEHFGYRVVAVGDYDSLMAEVDERTPDAVVIDIPGDGSIEIMAATEALRERCGADLPVLLASEHSDLEARLEAARAAAEAYLVKPFDLHELIDQLDRCSAEHSNEPFHIIIVEDSSTQATYYSAILKKAGMVATVVSDPMLLLDVLNENAADLILMDMYMPRCNGMELARVIRQFPRYASIPIVYLSAETEIDRQLDAMSLGGDDFLTKPINPAHLIRSVGIRAERARTLRTFMLTDNLTGLLNHTRIKEQLHNEVARAVRNGSNLSFAMLDIDHFKSVNDTHGHHVGDRVIKTLSRVLQQRLRKTDFIGRYGGEEFAVILVDADMDEAVAILDEIRASFSKIRQFAAREVFAVTFSGGVASFPASADAIRLALDADQALYAAKKAGRDRILPYQA